MAMEVHEDADRFVVLEEAQPRHDAPEKVEGRARAELLELTFSDGRRMTFNPFEVVEMLKQLRLAFGVKGLTSEDEFAETAQR